MASTTSEYRSIISKDVNGNIRGYVVRVDYIRNTSNQVIEDLRYVDAYGVRIFTSIESAKRSTARYIAKVVDNMKHQEKLKQPEKPDIKKTKQKEIK